jgi:hypothetical protein
MKAIVLYRPGTDESRTIEEFVRDFSHEYPDRKLEVVSLDTRDGASMAALYDIMQYPAILAVTSDGRLLQTWQGTTLPLMRDVAYYVDGVRDAIVS